VRRDCLREVTSPESGGSCGTAMKKVQMIDINWVLVGPGKLALTHRPRLKDIPNLVDLGCQRVVTLLSDREGASQIGRAVQNVGLAWTWLPVAHGKPPEGSEDVLLRRGLPDLSGYLDTGSALLLHCSAGIHRTGMVTYGLLRWRGVARCEALELIAKMRPVTREGLKEHHLTWGDQVVQAP
jgi:protein-tyrosine phosphatase